MPQSPLSDALLNSFMQPTRTSFARQMAEHYGDQQTAMTLRELERQDAVNMQKQAFTRYQAMHPAADGTPSLVQALSRLRDKFNILNGK